MQFDQSFVAIRSRNVFELFDLALQVLREYWWQLTVLLTCGAIPLTFLNYVLLTVYMNGQEDEFLTSTEGWIWLFLIYSQGQLGTSFVTYFLGQAVFRDRPGIQESLFAVLKRVGGLIWLQGVLRGVFLIWLPLLLMRREPELGGNAGDMGWFVFLSLIFGLVRLGRPFVNEIWLLERPSFVVKNANEEISFAKRSAVLHRGVTGEFSGRTFVFAFFGGGLLACLYMAANRLLQVSSLSADNVRIQETVLWVGALWATFGFLAVVRLLSYLDVRIRQEGWDVELLIRAEAYRLQE